jgi:hypothetical protein
MAKLKSILERLNVAEMQKTAAEKNPTKQTLEEVVKKVAADMTPAAVATAPGSSADAVATLSKVAASLLNADKEAQFAEAQMLGAAFADAAITKLASFEAQIASEKTASSAGNSADLDALIKIAAEIGYQDTQGRLLKMAMEAEEDKKDDTKKEEEKKMIPPFLKEKTEDKKPCPSEEEKAAAEYVQGYREAAAQIKEAAEIEFLKGAAIAEEIVARIQQGAR